ncbi:MAG: hypothetical protein ACKVT2_16490 [Saprospiraceae bacterium]
MTIVQHAQFQDILKYFETLQPEQIEQAFLSHWKPFVLSLSTEEDRALAFKLFYEWQMTQFDTLLSFLSSDQVSAAA